MPACGRWEPAVACDRSRQEHLLALSVSACRLVLEDDSTQPDDPAVAAVRRLLHPGQLTGLLRRPRLRRGALSVLALLAAAETDGSLQPPTAGHSTGALTDTLLAHTGRLLAAPAAARPPTPETDRSAAGVPPPAETAPWPWPARDVGQLEAELALLTDMWQTLVTAMSRWRPLGSAVLTRCPSLDRDLSSALDRLLRYTASLEDGENLQTGVLSPEPSKAG